MYTLVFNSADAVGRILFGITFLTIARNVNSKAIKDYLIMSAIGMILLFSSKSAAGALGTAPYPPFGLGTVLFVGLSSYLLLVGIYSSAISVSGDSRLCKSIRKFAIKEGWMDKSQSCVLVNV